ncbi:MAG: EthD domain-containing protein [Sphingomonadaceae bacterium]|nr:EthD domain-containing protein [Sphingomonadaceae bacterium]
MEKIIATLCGEQMPDPAALAAGLREAGATAVRINLRDEAVAPAAGLVQQSGASLPDAVVQFWLPSANPARLGATDTVLARYGTVTGQWLVTESTIIANTLHPPMAGERTHGFAQMAFLTLPEGRAWADWRRIWRDGHTQVAIDTQSNFEYVQNLVVEPLADGAAPFVAVVEECFPPAAMTDPLTFFDAAGDKAKFERNLAAMMESCARFITPGTIDVFATSQYDFA